MKYIEMSINEIANLNVGKFSIPRYQRGYVWDKKNYSDFYQDVILKGNWGGVVLCKETKDGAYEIIDGQQRLITIILFLRKFELIKNDNSNYDLSNISGNVNSDNNNIYLTNLKKCYEYFNSHNSYEYTSGKIISFLIVENTNDKVNVNEMFNNLNTKGVRLTDLEIIKNKIYFFISNSKLLVNEKNKMILEIDDCYYQIFTNIGKIQSLCSRWSNNFELEDVLIWMHWLTYSSFEYTRAIEKPATFTIFKWLLNENRIGLNIENKIESIKLKKDKKTSLIFSFKNNIDVKRGDVSKNIIFNSILNYEYDVNDIKGNELEVDCDDENDLKIWTKPSYLNWLNVINSKRFAYKSMSDDRHELMEYIRDLSLFTKSFFQCISNKNNKKIVFLSCLPNSWLSYLISSYLRNNDKVDWSIADYEYLYALSIRSICESRNKNQFLNPNQKIIESIKSNAQNRIRSQWSFDREPSFSLTKYWFLSQMIHLDNFIDIAFEMFQCNWIDDKCATIEHIYPLHRTREEKEYRNELNKIGNLCLIPRELNNQLGDKGFFDRKTIIHEYSKSNPKYKKIADYLIQHIQFYLDNGVHECFDKLDREQKDIVIENINKTSQNIIEKGYLK